jgi:hydroxyacylglutathione hydrolase
MIFRQLDSGGDRNFQYLIADEESLEAAVIDPGDNPAVIINAVRDENLKLVYIINTHSHFDHTGGNKTLSDNFGAKTACFGNSCNISLHDGDTLSLGKTKLNIIHTPGHTPDSICILAGNELVTGDTLFVGKVGGTGFGKDAREEYDSLHKKLMTLPPETRVWPGHDYGVRKSSTIGDELRENPFIQRKDFKSFLELKQNWTEYKRIHGIK